MIFELAGAPGHAMSRLISRRNIGGQPAGVRLRTRGYKSPYFMELWFRAGRSWGSCDCNCRHRVSFL